MIVRIFSNLTRFPWVEPQSPIKGRKNSEDMRHTKPTDLPTDVVSALSSTLTSNYGKPSYSERHHHGLSESKIPGTAPDPIVVASNDINPALATANNSFIASTFHEHSSEDEIFMTASSSKTSIDTSLEMLPKTFSEVRDDSPFRGDL